MGCVDVDVICGGIKKLIHLGGNDVIMVTDGCLNTHVLMLYSCNVCHLPWKVRVTKMNLTQLLKAISRFLKIVASDLLSQIYFPRFTFLDLLS
jgi:hypothetical protein